jgi:hypothetical protein
MQVTIELFNQDTFQLLQQLERLKLLKLLSFEQNNVATETNIVGYEMDGRPISETDFVESVLESSKEAKAGNLMSTSDLMKMLEL